MTSSNHYHLLVGIALLLSTLISPQVQATKLKIATLVPDGTYWMKSMRQAAKVIDEKTEGRVKLRFYPGGVMGNDKSLMRKIRVGQLHGGAITGGGLAAINPDLNLYSLPFLFRSYEEVDHVRQSMDPQIEAGLKKRGFISYGLSEGGFAYLMSNSRLNNLADLQQQKVWAPEGDPISQHAFKAVGVSPISLPLTDVLTGLQTGLINTVGTSPIGAITLQWHTRIKHLTDIPLLYLYASLVIHEKALKKLSNGDRETLEQELRDVFRKINTQNRKDNINARQALKNQGIQFNTPALDDMDKWRAATDRAVEVLGDNGSYSKALFSRMQKLLSEFRQ
ncbi:MAG: TRAP transporter substrate-binding protein DctP [Candidatus Sedimenticola sp. (ex Thyasira tokunagai)]